MNVSKRIVVTALSLAGALAAGAAQARGNVDVQWSVNIGGPIGVSVYSQPHRVYAPVPVGVPRYVHMHAYQDRDGIPNGYDRVYNPRWDRDGDGIPNRYDRVYNPRWDRDGDGVPNRYDRHPDDARGGHHDRDRDGAPNWRENRGDRGDRDNGHRDNRRGGRD